MFTTSCGTGSLPRAAGWPLIWAALVLAAATLGQALLHTAGVGTIVGVLLLGGATLVGGAILNRHAQVAGLPSAVAGIMALALYAMSAIEPSAVDLAGGPLFMALLLSVTARSVRTGLVVTMILSGALLLASLT